MRKIMLGVLMIASLNILIEEYMGTGLYGTISYAAWWDKDGDGIANWRDAFPDDPNESKDSDGDGMGDNGDAFPNDSGEQKDSDGDGVGDNSDVFPNDPDKSDPDPIEPPVEPVEPADLPEEKEGYTTSYLVIPDIIDITDPEQFFIAGINDSDQVIDKSVLEGDATDQDTDKILLNDDVSGSAPEGFKIVEVKVPVDPDESVKFSAGYKFQEAGLATEYVFLVEEDPDQGDAEDLTKRDPFKLIDPENYSYDSYPGISVSREEKYFMVPVRDTTKNFNMEFYSSEVPFRINDDGSIEVLAPFNLQVDILGSEYNAGRVYASVHIDNSENNWSEIKKWSNDLRTKSNRTPYIHPTTLPEGTKVGVKTWTSGSSGSSEVKKKSWDNNHVINKEGENGYIEVHRSNGEIKNIKIDPVDGQESLEKIVGSHVRVEIDEDGTQRAYANIGPQDIIILTEHYTNNPSSSSFDLQDLVALVTLTAIDTGPIYRITLVHDNGLFSSEDTSVIAETSSSNRKRSSEVEFKVIDTGSSEVNFEIRSIDE